MDKDARDIIKFLLENGWSTGRQTLHGQMMHRRTGELFLVSRSLPLHNLRNAWAQIERIERKYEAENKAKLFAQNTTPRPRQAVVKPKQKSKTDMLTEAVEFLSARKRLCPKLTDWLDQAREVLKS